MFHIGACADENYRKILMILKLDLLSFNLHVLPKFQFPTTNCMELVSAIINLVWIWFCACPMECWVPISSKLIHVFYDNIIDHPSKFENILTTFTELMDIFIILHLRIPCKIPTTDFLKISTDLSHWYTESFMEIWKHFNIFYVINENFWYFTFAHAQT